MVDANLHIGVNCVNSGNEIAHDEAMHLNPVNSNEPKESEVRINDDQHLFVMQIRKLIRFVLVTQKRGLHVCYTNLGFIEYFLRPAIFRPILNRHMLSQMYRSLSSYRRAKMHTFLFFPYPRVADKLHMYRLHVAVQ